MTTRKNRPQINFQLDGPGLSVRKATNVPFIPATRRTGVGDNAARMGSALQGLGKALGSFSGSGSFGGQTEAQRKAEEKRYAKYVADQGKEGPEERVARETVNSHAPSIINQFETDAAVKKLITGEMGPQMEQQIQRWAANGWMVGDDTGAMNKIDAPYVKQFFKDYRDQNIYTPFGKGTGKEGDLNAPQLGRLQNFADAAEVETMRALTEHNAKKLVTKSENLAAEAAADHLVQGVQKGLTGDKLATAFFKAGEDSAREINGKGILSAQERMTIGEKRLGELHRQLVNTGSDRLARSVDDLLNGKLPHGRTVRDTYPQAAKKLEAELKKIVIRTDTNESKNLMSEEAYDAFIKGKSPTIQARSAKLYAGTDDEKEVKVSKKELEGHIKRRIIEKAHLDFDVDENPANALKADQSIVTKFAGSELVHDNAKLQFTEAAWKEAASGDGSGLFKMLDLYKHVVAVDREKLEKYIPSEGMRSRLRLFEAMRRVRPATSPVEAAMAVENAIDTQTKKVYNWDQAAPGAKKVYNKYRSTKDYAKAGLSLEDEQHFAAVVRARVALREDVNRDDRVDEDDIEQILDEELEELTKHYTRVNGTNIYNPAFRDPKKNVPAPLFAQMVEKSMASMARHLDISQRDIRLTPLPGRQGFIFKGKDGKVLRHPNGSKMIMMNDDIHRHFTDTTSAEAKAKIIRQQGSVGSQLELESKDKLEAARKSVGTKNDWWTSKHTNKNLNPRGVSKGSFTTDSTSNTGSPRAIGGDKRISRPKGIIPAPVIIPRKKK